MGKVVDSNVGPWKVPLQQGRSQMDEEWYQLTAVLKYFQQT